MDSQPNLFLIIFLLLSFMIWQIWQLDHKPYFQENKIIQNKNNISDDIVSHETIDGKEEKITIKTDVLLLDINMRGGDIAHAQLLTYPSELGSNVPFKLLETTPPFVYQAQSGLIGLNGPDNPNNRDKRPLYKSSHNYFEMKNGQKVLTVPITWTNKEGVIFTKTFTFKSGEFAVNINYHINNTSKKPLKVIMFGQLKQTIDLPKNRNKDNNNFALHTFRGAAYSTNKVKYDKYKFDTIAKNKNLNINTTNGWIAMLQQYFATAWIPHTQGENTLYTNNLGNGVVAIGYKSSLITIPVDSQKDINATLWIGPEIQDKMAKAAKYLDLTVDYGWLWFISQPLFKLLKLLHKFVGNWGFSIVIITFIVRAIMYPLTKAQYNSMAKMRLLQPKIKAIRERLGDDKQKISQEMLALYKSENVNPLGGCLPVVIQMPIFLALYYMLSSSVELRHAPFILWMHDLSAQDPYYILPIIMGITMFFIQKISPSTINDPMQQKVMNYMPIIFTVFFLWFPSGLVLYYIVSNIFTILQQRFIHRSLG